VLEISRTTVVGAALVGAGLALMTLSPAGALELREPRAADGSSATATPSASVSPSGSASATSTPSVSASASAAGTATPTASTTSTAEPSVSATSTSSASPSASPSCPPGSTSSAQPSSSTDPSATASVDPSATASVDPSATASATASGSASPSASASRTGLPIPTLVPLPFAAPSEPARDEVSCRAATISLATNFGQITAGNAPTLSGVVRDGRGDALAGATVTIYAKGYGDAAYAAVATVRTDSAGQYQIQVRPTKQTAYGANVGDARSPVLVIRVYTRVNLSRPAPGAVANPVTFAGGLVPGYARVAVGLGYLTGGRFVVLTQASTDARGAFSITATLPRGTNTFVVFTSPHQGTDKGARSLRLDVG